MVGAETSSRLEMGWADDALELRIEVDDEGMVRLRRLAPPARSRRIATGMRGPDDEAPHEQAIGLPLVDVVTSGEGRAWSGRRYAESVTGGRLRYVGHDERVDGPWRELRIVLEDSSSGLAAEVMYTVLEHGGVLRSQVRLTNRGSGPVTVESVTSFLGSGLAGAVGSLGDIDLMWADNAWLAEGRWQRRAFRDALPDLNRKVHEHDSRSWFGLTSAGSWSSGTYLPLGAAINRRTGNAWAWQIEHNGGWHWQVGEHTGHAATSEHLGGALTDAYLALMGPTDAELQWRLFLKPGESFETVPVAVAVSNEGFEAAVACLTNYRRAMRRPHDDHRRLPVIFNDYLNTLMGDPTTERLLPLITAAARAGAEYFCIDSGWYTEIGEGWWDTVGAWKPSKTRFPNGITEVLDHIRAEGMIPGLWLEPEVVGTRSTVATQLPQDAFFIRDGERVVEQGRYHLDLSHPAAMKHLDEVVDFLAGDLGIGYLKMDYNINVGPGTESGNVSAGVGMLAHNRAFLDWVDGVLDRHAGLTIENCASGGMRTDYALLSRCQLQSTSDQQDFLRYPAIAAAAPTAIAPEQAAVWTCPQPGWSDNEIAFSLCGAMLGRLNLSGHIDRMSQAQQQLVGEGVSAYKHIRSDLAYAVPFWPLGLPQWTDQWFALGMRAPSATYLVVWHRGELSKEANQIADPSEIVFSVPHLLGQNPVLEVLYPSFHVAVPQWNITRGELHVAMPHVPSACVIRCSLEPAQ
ncbi:MAG: alpha-galactosidase [Acidimicrobiales bacterium]